MDNRSTRRETTLTDEQDEVAGVDRKNEIFYDDEDESDGDDQRNIYNNPTADVFWICWHDYRRSVDRQRIPPGGEAAREAPDTICFRKIHFDSHLARALLLETTSEVTSRLEKNRQHPQALMALCEPLDIWPQEIRFFGCTFQDNHNAPFDALQVYFAQNPRLKRLVLGYFDEEGTRSISPMLNCIQTGACNKLSSLAFLSTDASACGQAIRHLVARCSQKLNCLSFWHCTVDVDTCRGIGDGLTATSTTQQQAPAEATAPAVCEHHPQQQLELELISCGLTDALLRSLLHAGSTISTLHLGDNQLTISALTVLAPVVQSTLRQLTLANNPLLFLHNVAWTEHEQFYQALAASRSLQLLNLTDCGVNNESASKLLSALQGVGHPLHELNLDGNRGMNLSGGVAWIQCLRRLSNLRVLITPTFQSRAHRSVWPELTASTTPAPASKEDQLFLSCLRQNTSLEQLRDGSATPADMAGLMRRFHFKPILQRNRLLHQSLALQKQRSLWHVSTWAIVLHRWSSQGNHGSATYSLLRARHQELLAAASLRPLKRKAE